MTFNGTLHENAYIFGVSPPCDTDSTTVPASGSYIDVTDYNKFAFLVHLGSVASSGDFRVYSATSKTGGLVHVTGATKTDMDASADNNKWFSIEVESAKLPTTHHMVALTITSLSGTSLWSAMFLAWECRHGSPTQSTGYDSHTVIAG